jgi:hypothetical protein
VCIAFVVALTNGYCEAMMHHVANVRPVVDIYSPPPDSKISPFDTLQSFEDRLWKMQSSWTDPPLQYAPVESIDEFLLEFQRCLAESIHPSSVLSRTVPAGSGATPVAGSRASGSDDPLGSGVSPGPGSGSSGVSPGSALPGTGDTAAAAAKVASEAAAAKSRMLLSDLKEAAAAAKVAREAAAAQAADQAAAKQAAKEEAKEEAKAAHDRQNMLDYMSKQARESELLLAALLDRRQGDAAQLAESVTAESICASDPLGQTALHHAVRLRYLNVVQILCRRMPTLVNTFTAVSAKPSHWSPLHVVADMAVGSDLDVVNSIGDCLIAAAGRRGLDAQTNKGATALMLAACRGHTHTLSSSCLRPGRMWL